MVSSVCHDQVVQSLKPFTTWEVIVNKNLCCDAWSINRLKKDQAWETTYVVVDLNLIRTNLTLNSCCLVKLFLSARRTTCPNCILMHAAQFPRKQRSQGGKNALERKEKKIVRGNGWLPWAMHAHPMAGDRLPKNWTWAIKLFDFGCKASKDHLLVVAVAVSTTVVILLMIIFGHL